MDAANAIGGMYKQLCGQTAQLAIIYFPWVIHLNRGYIEKRREDAGLEKWGKIKPGGLFVVGLPKVGVGIRMLIW